MNIIINFRDILWSHILIWLILFTGIWLTINLRFIQFRKFFSSMALVLRPKRVSGRAKGDISSFQALMTALSGAIGTGNIAGIATGVVLGGIGSLFWMWLVALISMATAYSETYLAMKYRELNEDGRVSGGPMYTLKNGAKNNLLAYAFAFFVLMAGLGIGSTIQSHSVAEAMHLSFGFNKLYVGIALSIMAFVVIIGGIGNIGRVAGFLVPFMAISYLLSGIAILIINYQFFVQAIQSIFYSAFSSSAVFGGFTGSSVLLALQYGASKGVFSNEAGLGSLAIAASSAKTADPDYQGQLSMAGVFLSTMVVCSITGLVLAVYGVKYPFLNHDLNGASLVITAFADTHEYLQYVVIFSLCLFAFTTILAWAYYAEKSLEFLLNAKYAYTYRYIHVIAIVVGSSADLNIAWAFADIANGCMAIPNLLGLFLLYKKIKNI